MKIYIGLFALVAVVVIARATGTCATDGDSYVCIPEYEGSCTELTSGQYAGKYSKLVTSEASRNKCLGSQENGFDWCSDDPGDNCVANKYIKIYNDSSCTDQHTILGNGTATASGTQPNLSSEVCGNGT